jgi:hypothetical protein
MADDNDNDGGSSRISQAVTNQRQTISQQASSRTIFGFMAFAMLFGVAGAELKNLDTKATGVTGKVGNALSDPVLIVLGGTVATSILVLIAQAGETGRKFGVGMSGLVLTTAVFVNGAPLWNLLSDLFGSSPTTPIGSKQGSTSGKPAATATTTTSKVTYA